MPRSLLGTTAVAAVALTTLLAGGVQGEIASASSYAEALDQARQADQLVIIDFFTDW